MTARLNHPNEDRDRALREPPNNMEAEQAVLGALLANNEAMNHVVPELRAEHFHAGVHQRIFSAYKEFRDKGVMATAVTLHTKFQGQDGIEGHYLAKLVGHATSIINIHDYSRIIVELAMRRAIIATAEEVVHVGYDPASDKSAGELSGLMAGAINHVTQHTAMKRMRTSRDAGIAFIESLKAPNRRISSGIPRFDKAMGGGFRRGQVYAIAASPGHGKTMIAGTISHNLNYAGHKHLFVCAEMGDEEIHARSLARLVGCSNEDLTSDDPQMNWMQQEAARYAMADPANVIYQSDSYLTFDALKQFVANAVARHRVELVVLDYFQLVGGMEKNGNIVRHYEEVAQWLAATAKAYDLSMLITAQLNEEGKARWGDAMKMAFTNLFHLHRVNDAGEEDKNGQYAWLEMEKCRHTKFRHVGSPTYPALRINDNGPYFEEIEADNARYSQQGLPAPASS